MTKRQINVLIYSLFKQLDHRSFIKILDGLMYSLVIKRKKESVTTFLREHNNWISQQITDQ